jgi:hypothetical protein
VIAATSNGVRAKTSSSSTPTRGHNREYGLSKRAERERSYRDVSGNITTTRTGKNGWQAPRSVMGKISPRLFPEKLSTPHG